MFKDGYQEQFRDQVAVDMYSLIMLVSYILDFGEGSVFDDDFLIK